jgi:hypothetical protein
LPAGTSYTLDTGFGPPGLPYYDLVVDLRALKDRGRHAPRPFTAWRR